MNIISTLYWYNVWVFWYVVCSDLPVDAIGNGEVTSVEESDTTEYDLSPNVVTIVDWSEGAVSDVSSCGINVWGCCEVVTTDAGDS